MSEAVDNKYANKHQDSSFGRAVFVALQAKPLFMGLAYDNPLKTAMAENRLARRRAKNKAARKQRKVNAKRG